MRDETKLIHSGYTTDPTTHRQMTDAEQLSAGVTSGMIRLCIGIEHQDDIIAGLQEALCQA